MQLLRYLSNQTLLEIGHNSMINVIGVEDTCRLLYSCCYIYCIVRITFELSVR